jgi:hypothetical protein
VGERRLAERQDGELEVGERPSAARDGIQRHRLVDRREALRAGVDPGWLDGREGSSAQRANR